MTDLINDNFTIMKAILKTVILLFSICFFIQCNDKDKEKVISEINTLMGNEYINEYKVLNIIEVKNICAIFIKPPYREFPNIILFKLKDGNFQRIKEGLTIGIIDKPSGVLDLHTKGLGVDLKIKGIDNYNMNLKEVQKTIEFGIKQNNGGFSIYSNFIHMHTIEGASGFYLLDKTRFESIAIKLYGAKIWNNYPKDNCEMYDLPEIIKSNLEYKYGKYILNCKTSNKQEWIVSFSNSDPENTYLLNKEIQVN